MLSKLKEQLLKGQTLILKIKVTPQSGNHEISKIMTDGTLKVKLKSAPEKNKANEELIELLAESFEIDAQKITISHGQTAPRKTIIIKP